jgi:hypothetical protein
MAKFRPNWKPSTSHIEDLSDVLALRAKVRRVARCRVDRQQVSRAQSLSLEVDEAIVELIWSRGWGLVDVKD